MTNLIKAVGAVMAEVGTLKKDGHNDFSNYDFTTEAMVVGTLRPLLVKNGLIFVPHNVSVTHSEQINEKMRRVIISSTFLLAHVSGESLTITLPGEGMDSLDESTNKALTAALKYGLLQTFCVGRGDDGDAIQRVQAKTSENAAVRAAAGGDPGPSVHSHDFAIPFPFAGGDKGQRMTTLGNTDLDKLAAYFEKASNNPAKSAYKADNKDKMDRCMTEKLRRSRNAMDAVVADEIPF